MKTKFLFVAALTILMCASCQKEVSDCAGQPGLDTYTGLTISLPKELVVSRALVDGTAEESAINSIKIGTWSDGNNAITYTTLLGSEFTNDSNGNYTATKAVKAKTGKNNFIVIVNSTEELTIPQVNGAALTKTVANIATNNSFVMYSREVKSLPNVQLASKEEVERATSGSALYTSNRTSVTLRRAAAKVSVTSSLDATDETTGVLDALGNGTLYNIKWNIANQNEHMTAIVDKLDEAGDFVVKNVNSPFSKIPNIIPALIVPKKGDAANYAYCLENSNGLDVYTEKNTTAVHVTATFAPAAGKYISEFDTTNPLLPVPIVATGALSKGQTFYVSKKIFVGLSDGTFFSTAAVVRLQQIFGVDESDPNSAATIHFTQYRQGICHWPVYIHDGTKPTPNYGVLRNHIYEMNIKSIKAPGFAGFPETDKPISTNAHIQVDLSVKGWTDWNMGSIEM